MSWLIFVDKSDDRNISYVSVLIIADSNKASVYNSVVKWVKHSKKLGKKKISYFNDFPERYSRILPFIEVSRAFSYFKGSKLPQVLFSTIDAYVDDYTIFVIDDKLVKAFQKRYPGHVVFVEGKLTDKQLEKIMDLADNVCNYFRLKKDLNTIWK